MFSKSQQEFASASVQGYPEVDVEFLIVELNREHAITSEAETSQTHLLTESSKVKKFLIQRKRTFSR